MDRSDTFDHSSIATDVTWTHPFLDAVLYYIPLEVKSVLDVGCGKGVVGALLRIYRQARTVVGADIFEPYLDFCKSLGVYSKLVKHDLVYQLPFSDGEFDVSVGLEVIEHLQKKDGFRLLSEMERVSRRVIISTPNRFFRQSAYDQNTHQLHLSEWSPRDFKKRGYSVFGVGPLMIGGREIRFISTILGRVSYPKFSSIILAVRK